MLNIDVKVLFDSSDKLTCEQEKIIRKHLEAMSAELGEDVNIGTFLHHRIYPDTLYNDGVDDVYGLMEGRDYIKDERRAAKIKALKARKS